MSDLSAISAMVLRRFRTAKRMGNVLASVTGKSVHMRQVEIAGQSLTNFASCSYLGLDQHPKLIAGSVAATQAYGTAFSTSRAYLQLGLYEELESKLSQVFGAPTIISASTTLGHQSLMPVVVSNEDLLLVDGQAHNSLQDATIYLQGRGTKRILVRHNDIEDLEEHLTRLCDCHPAVWYIADGVYSIYGDVAPFAELQRLLDKFPNLHMYFDDAHGMGWIGKNGRGLAIESMGIHPRIVYMTSFSKAAATGGGAIVMPTQEMAELVRNTGKTLTFSGPLVPAQLGALEACVDILLSPEIDAMQIELQRKCTLFRNLTESHGLNLIDDSISPVFYVEIGNFSMALEVAAQIRNNHGIFVTPSGYPAVPIHAAGLRITITLIHTDEQIRRLAVGIHTEITNAHARKGQVQAPEVEQKVMTFAEMMADIED